MITESIFQVLIMVMERGRRKRFLWAGLCLTMQIRVFLPVDKGTKHNDSINDMNDRRNNDPNIIKQYAVKSPCTVGADDHEY